MSSPTPSRYALILAGGSGERFWPLSRRTRPKQLLRLFSPHTLLENTLSRLEGIIPPENTLVLTNQEQHAGVREVLNGRLPEANIVAEPVKRDTAPAIALGVAWVASRDHQALMSVLPADHLIRDIDAFQKDLDLAYRAAAHSGSLVTIGVRPTWPCPSFGYIERGAAATLPGVDHSSISEVARFREKPNEELAETFLRQGNFSWNAGMFIWGIPSILCEMAAHAPELARFVESLCSRPEHWDNWGEAFAKLPKTSIDYAVMEHAGRVLVIDAGFDWDDIGNWHAISKYLNEDSGGNRTNCELSSVASTRNLVYSSGDKHIALLGVEDLIVVDSPDAILITRASHADHIRELVAQLPRKLQ